MDSAFLEVKCVTIMLTVLIAVMKQDVVRFIIIIGTTCSTDTNIHAWVEEGEPG